MKSIIALLMILPTLNAQIGIVGKNTLSSATTVGGVQVLSITCPAVTGNGSTDDTAAMQNCLNGLPSYYELLIPAGMTMKITSTLNFHTRTGIVIAGMSGTASSLVSGSAAPSLLGQNIGLNNSTEAFVTSGNAHLVATPAADLAQWIWEGTTLQLSEGTAAYRNVLPTLATPADNATCVTGTMWLDAGFIYVCTASGTVKRAALSTF